MKKKKINFPFRFLQFFFFNKRKSDSSLFTFNQNVLEASLNRKLLFIDAGV